MSLKVIAHIASEDLYDPDALPDVSWSEDNPVPCYFLGAWADSLDFLGKRHQLRIEQNEFPERWLFIFNLLPKSIEDIERAIKEWASD
jgi:hypothetical protein